MILMRAAAQENSVGDHKRTSLPFLTSSRTDRESLEGRSHFKSIVEKLFVVMKAWTPVRGLVVLLCLQEPDDPFYLFQAFRIPGVLKLVLIAEPNRIHHVIETFDDMAYILIQGSGRIIIIHHLATGVIV